MDVGARGGMTRRGRSGVRDGMRGVRERMRGLKLVKKGGQSYEGLPPEVGAFNFEKWPHAPWPVHNFDDFHVFSANLRP